MALSADVSTFKSDAKAPLIKIPVGAAAADIFYRGGLTFDSATGIVITGAADSAAFGGVVAERTVTTAADDPVNCYIFGHFLFAPGATASVANERAKFTQTTASGDDPVGLVVTAPGVGISGYLGVLTSAKTAGTDGWFLTGVGLFI